MICPSLLAGVVPVPQGQIANTEKLSEREPLKASYWDQEEVLHIIGIELK